MHACCRLSLISSRSASLVSTIFNYQTVNYTYVTNKIRNKHFLVIYALQNYKSQAEYLREGYRVTKQFFRRSKECFLSINSCIDCMGMDLRAPKQKKRAFAAEV